jgi:hypothetical protein
MEGDLAMGLDRFARGFAGEGDRFLEDAATHLSWCRPHFPSILTFAPQAVPARAPL